MKTDSEPVVVEATEEDLRVILGWLKDSYYNDEVGGGFWNNSQMIEESLGTDLRVVRQDGEAVAFQVGDYYPGITCVHPKRRKEGFGTVLFNATLDRAMQNNMNVLTVKCSPVSSASFWRRHGFEPYGEPSDSTMIRVLRREWKPPEGEEVLAVVSFYEPSGEVGSGPILDRHELRGVSDGQLLHLERRVIGPFPPCQDIGIVVQVDGTALCSCRLKDSGAIGLGVKRDMGGVAYIDRLDLRGQG